MSQAQKPQLTDAYCLLDAMLDGREPSAPWPPPKAEFDAVFADYSTIRVSAGNPAPDREQIWSNFKLLVALSTKVPADYFDFQEN